MPADPWRRRLGWFCGASLFLAYPLALVAPVETYSSLVFYFSLPVFLLVSVCSLCLLACAVPGANAAVAASPAAGDEARQAQRLVLDLLWGFGVLAACCVISGVVGRVSGWAAVVECLGCFAVPLAFALGLIAVTPRLLSSLLAVLWLVNAAHGLWQAQVGFEVVGLTGNRNWMSTLMVALAPWAVYVLMPAPGWTALGGWFCRRRAGSEVPESPERGWGPSALPASESSERGGGPSALPASESSERGWGPSALLARMPHGLRAALVTAAAVAVAGVALWLARQGQSRATWLVLAVYVAVYGLLRPLSWLARVLLVCGVAMILLLGVILVAEDVSRTIHDDIRIPLWAQTVRMVREHPWLGVGPGNFERDFVAYKSTAHRERLVAAPVTEHPHNELLRVSAELGVLPGLAFCALVAVLLLPRGASTHLRLLHFTGWMLVGHGLFDKALVQPPLSLLACMCLGLLWRERLQPAQLPADAAVAASHASGVGIDTAAPEARAVRRPWRAAALGVAVVFLLAGLAEAVRLIAYSWKTRQGLVAEYAQANRAAYDAYVAASRWYPRRLEAHLLAAVMANERLAQPAQALPHLETLRRLAPDYAHTNGQIGLALGSLGRNDQAWPYFEREALGLYPFDPLALRRYALCALATGRRQALAVAVTRLPALDRRRAVQALGEARVQELTCSFLRALRTPQPEAGVAAAAALTASTIHGWPCDPALPDLLAAAGLKPQAVIGSAFSAHDFTYWQAWRDAVNWLRDRRPDAPAPFFADSATDRALVRTRLRAAGWTVLVLADEQRRDLGLWELWRGGEHVVVRAADGGRVSGDSLAMQMKAPDKLTALGVVVEEPGKCRLLCPLPLSAFLPHNLILANLLQPSMGTGRWTMDHGLWTSTQEPGTETRTAGARMALSGLVLMPGLSPSVHLGLSLPAETVGAVTLAIEPATHAANRP